MKKIKLSIIINHHRTPNILRMCLDAIRKEVVSIDHEIIVTDSESEESTVGMLQREYPDVFYIGFTDNVGFSKCVNPAIQQSNGEFIFSINADIITQKDHDIKNMIAYLEKNTEVGVLGPQLLNIDGTIQQSYFREYTFLTVLARRTAFGRTAWGKKIIKRFTYQDDNGKKTPMAADWLMGSAMLMKRDRLEKVGGGFDDRFFMYFEDADLCRRFRSAGYKAVYYPLATFIHYHIRASHGGRGTLDIFKNWLTRVHITSYFKYLWKWRVESFFKSGYNK